HGAGPRDGAGERRPPRGGRRARARGPRRAHRRVHRPDRPAVSRARRRWSVPEPDVPPHLEPGDPADLDDATTTGVDLTGAVVAGLREAQVENSELGRVRANAAQWERVTLADCRLDGADLANLVWRDGSLQR